MALAAEQAIQEVLKKNFNHIITNDEIKHPDEGEEENQQKIKNTYSFSIPQLIEAVLLKAYLKDTKEIQLDHREGFLNVTYICSKTFIDRKKTSATEYDAILTRLKSLAQIDVSKKKIFAEGLFRKTFKEREVYLRLYIFPTLLGETASIKFS